MEKSPCGPCFEFEPSLFEPGVYFNIKCIGKLLGPTNEFERSLVFETGEFERPKFDCISMYLQAEWNRIYTVYKLDISRFSMVRVAREESSGSTV